MIYLIDKWLNHLIDIFILVDLLTNVKLLGAASPEEGVDVGVGRDAFRKTEISIG